jgi:FKBP-type peptidyl-prolyl cis-trans isomerase FkpA
MSTITAVPLRPVKRGYLVWLWVGIAAAILAAAALAWAADPGIGVTASGLRYKVLKPGEPNAPHPTDTDIALVQYTGKLADGTVFDKSERPTPFPVNAVVPGFSEGLKLMSKGAQYRLWIKPELGYGAEAKGPIPANSTLQFDVELVDFLPEETVRRYQQQQMMGMPGGPGGPGGGAIPGGPGGVPVPPQGAPGAR